MSVCRVTSEKCQAKRQTERNMRLEIKNVSYQYGENDRKILEDFSLTVEEHERVGLIACTDCP